MKRLLLVSLCMGIALPAHALLLMELNETVGGDVVLTVSGSVDSTAGLSSAGSIVVNPIVNPQLGIVTSSAGGILADGFGFVTGPTSFGTINTSLLADSSSGDAVGIDGGVGVLLLPTTYSLGDPLSATATFNSTDLATIGATPGVYTWTWAGDSAQLTISAIPEPSVYIAVAGFVGLGIFAWRRRKRPVLS